MSERFTETQMYSLAEIYRDYECLWNVTSDLYKDRAARESAYQKILERLNIPGLTIRDIPKKIKNLRSSYYQEIKRIQNSMRAGACEDSVYKPKVSWFTLVEGFLKPFRNQRETVSYNDSNSASDSELETPNTEPMVEATLEEDSMADETGEVDWGMASHAGIAVQRENENSSPGFFMLPSKKQAKKRCIVRKDDNIHIALAKVGKIANSLSRSASTLSDKADDEFDSFGKYIAMTLRSLPMELAIAGKTGIQNVLSEIQLRALRENSELPLIQYDAPRIKLEYP
ncbi:uncharacterized protein [Maniola hyperantus]|uniref:uncharacterized protein n=1 Tax=Aphantopus hyperantus TaxID=2795564 RepID=UPI00374A5D12